MMLNKGLHSRALFFISEFCSKARNRLHGRLFFFSIASVYYEDRMSFPVKVCVICSEEFELKPDKPGFANRCPECSASESNAPATNDPGTKHRRDATERKSESEANEARRQAMRDLLYRKDS